MFGDIQAVAEQVGAAEAMGTVVAIVAGPAIMYGAALIAGPDPNVLKSLMPSFAMLGVQGEPGSRIEVISFAQSFLGY